ncbi:hypothetical protein [Nonomuraea sp. NEAU-A123]|uniref:hypothetical protein n=1 Tax=Nonomuraea sp. NEAU-A123 TaxID=2839649 RepID=UPI001BE3FAA0|nr:hypothetical protein [Nonomuraea sp. NEAU-A123]MBT2233326.1 hypothetical protein [Nonomuraea sp. NEAU-A123]
MKIERPGQKDDTPNPGSGTGDPRLVTALLTRFRDVQEWSYMPGAVVALPVADMESTFIPSRQISSPFGGPEECDKWTAGMWFAVLQRYNTAGVQVAVTQTMEFSSPGAQRPRRPESAGFSEAIITGSPAMLNRLGDPNLPAQCHHLSDANVGSGDIQPLPVPHLGERSWAYRITGSGKVPIWQWVEVIQTSRYLLEIRIPNQEPRPRTDPAKLLPQIAQEAYAKTEAAFQ